MFWKKWPTWFKGGFIAALIPLILYLVVWFSDRLVGIRAELAWSFFMFISYPATPVFFMISKFAPYSVAFTAYLLNIILIYFFVGMVIGWIVGRIKNRRLARK